VAGFVESLKILLSATFFNTLSSAVPALIALSASTISSQAVTWFRPVVTSFDRSFAGAEEHAAARHPHQRTGAVAGHISTAVHHRWKRSVRGASVANVGLQPNKRTQRIHPRPEFDGKLLCLSIMGKFGSIVK